MYPNYKNVLLWRKKTLGFTTKYELTFSVAIVLSIGLSTTSLACFIILMTTFPPTPSYSAYVCDCVNLSNIKIHKLSSIEEVGLVIDATFFTFLFVVGQSSNIRLVACILVSNEREFCGPLSSKDICI